MHAWLLRAVIVPMAVALTMPSAAHGQATVTALEPTTVRPGATARLTVEGKELTDGLRVVTARPLAPVRIESIDPAKTKATAVIDVPADAIGPVGVLAATPAGPAAMRTILIDDLPALAASGTNISPKTAQPITIPGCIDGTTTAGTSAYYRFTAAAGQRVAVEVVTRQAGSMMDPVVRLLNASGRVLVTSDDGPTGPECRFRHVFTVAGDYMLELQANAYAGGMPYHLRIGDFPLVSHALPLAVQQGVATRVGFGGLDAAAVPPVEVKATAAGDGGRFLAAKLPRGRSSTWVPLLVHDAPQMVEPPATAPLPIPVGVSGRLEAPGERDAYRIQGRAGQTLRFMTRGQSLGCGTVPQLRLVDAAGKVVAVTAASANDHDPNAVLVLEPQLTFTFASDGDYRLEVNDLGRRGGPGFGYFFAVEPAGVDVEFKPDPKARLAFAVEPAQGCAPVDLVVKRAGYEGDVTVSLAEPVPGLRVVNPLIPEQATQARIYLAADASWSPQAMAIVRLVAQAGQRPARPVSTAAFRAVHDKASTTATPVGDGGMLLAGVPGGAPRFELAPAGPVQLTRTGTTHAIPLTVKRLDPAFKGPVTIAGSLLPRGFSATSTMDKDTCLVTLTGAATPVAEPTSLRLLAVSDIGNRTALSVIDLPVTWTGTPSAPPAPPAAAIALAPGTKAPAFMADYAATIEAMKPRVASSLAGAAAPLNAKGTVQFADAGFATFSAGRLDGGGAPLGSSWSASLWFMNSLDVNARAVTAYLFSRGPDGDVSGGDHLGIGGSFRPHMPGKLLVFNGNSRNSMVLGQSQLRPNEWHHVVMVRDGNRVRVYMDGAAQPEIDADLEPTATGMGGYFFGARADNFAPLQGGMAHVAVFDRPLTADEATRLHAAAIGRVPAAAPQASKNGDPPPPVQKAFEPDPPLPETATRPEAVPPTQAAAQPPQPAPQAPASPAADAAPLGPGLHVYPPRIALDGSRDRQQIAITTVDDAGFPCDWTRKARITIANPSIASLRGTTIIPAGDGETEAVIEADGRRQSVAITVTNIGVSRPVQFENDLMVALSKQTCSSGACHGSPSGKGGFRLSLRASEKQLDELTIIREEFGRRINPIDPDASILLKKPLMQVPHGGGKQLALDDEAYAVMRAWIAEGGKADPPNTPRCVRLEVSPAGRQVQRLAEGGRQIVATAHYADGSRRDVSHLVAYESSSMSVAAVDSHGWVTPKKRGETVILVRYLEHIELVPLMFIEEVPGFVWQAPPENNEIDRLIDEKLRDLQYPPSAICTDQEFVRRVFLDVIGMLPTVEETTAFLADTSPNKRSQLIDRLLEREEYARFSTLKWGDILRMTKKHAGDQGVYKYHRWLEDAFRTNKPHDQLARELLLGSGSTFDNPPANFYRTTADMNETVETVSQLFLGVRLQCAKCHNHPFDRWSQDNYYGLGAFFERVQKRKTPLADETFVFVAASGETKQPRTGKTVKPWLPKVGDIDTPAEADRREAFVTWLLAHDNPFFARVEANRIWSQFFARGIVHPVDEFRDSNPPSNGPLLDWLGAKFTKSGFDRKHLIRTILRSRTYQTSSVATPLNKADTLYFSHQLPRLLGAEQLLDAIGQVTGLEQQFGTLPTGTKATQLPAPDIAKLDFLKMLGQPERGTVCACERSEDSSLGMAIELFNGKVINAKLADPGNRVRTALAAGKPVEDVIRELYVAAVCRQPTPEEIAAAMAQCQAAKEPAQGVEDVCWALLNSDEFVFQH